MCKLDSMLPTTTHGKRPLMQLDPVVLLALVLVLVLALVLVLVLMLVRLLKVLAVQILALHRNFPMPVSSRGRLVARSCSSLKATLLKRSRG